MNWETNAKSIISHKWYEFSLTPCLTFGVIDESNIDSEILDEDVHASKPNEITSLAYNMSKNIFTMHKKSNRKVSEIEGLAASVKNRNAKTITQDSLGKMMWSGENKLPVKQWKSTLKMEVKELLQAVIMMNKKKASIECKSSSYS